MKNLDYNTLHLKNTMDQMNQMNNLDCDQIKIFINLEIIGEKKNYISLFKIKFYNLVKPLGVTTVSKQNKDQMKNLDCNQIKIFINLEIIGK